MAPAKDPQKVVEQQFWLIGIATGIIVLALVSSALFAWAGLQILGATMNIERFGVSGVGATLIVSLLISRVIVGRLLGYSVVTLTSITSYFGGLLSRVEKADSHDAEEFCHNSDPLIAVVSGLFGSVLLGYFLLVRWSCETANLVGGLAYATCSWNAPGPFRHLLLSLVRLIGGGSGVAGVFFLSVFVLELRFLWRGSTIEELYRNSPLYFWIHPVKKGRQEVANYQHSQQKQEGENELEE